MSEAPAAELAPLSTEQLDHLGVLDTEGALSALERAGCHTAETVIQLAQAALSHAEADPRLAGHWLSIAVALNQRFGDQPFLMAQIEYAQARLYADTGDLAAAEAALRRAQIRWQAVGDQPALTRSYLGLTAILARQGRYAEAETAIRQAIAALASSTPSDPPFLQLVRARDNLATLLSYQDRHPEALEEYTRLQQSLEEYRAQEQHDDATLDEIEVLFALNALNRATSLTNLDQHDAAEFALQSAIMAFGQLEDRINRARSYINLGILYLRTGRYAAALAQFDHAAADLTREPTLETEDDATFDQADALLLALERAMAYVALNLVPEATAALERCVLLYRDSNQPYEWGQALFALGMVHLRTENYWDAAAALHEAEHTFTALQNAYWINRTNVALAYLAYQQHDSLQATARLIHLPGATTGEPAEALATLAWDINTLVEGYLLQLYVQLDSGETQAARRTAIWIAQLLGSSADPEIDVGEEISQLPLPHLQLRLRHALGRVEWQDGHYGEAEAHLMAAIELLEAQRITLPLEEVRTAFVDDKTDIYNDLMLVQLAAPQPSPDAMAAAFATLERARSRTLLERLLALGEPAVENGLDTHVIAQREEVRRQLHWLYNQLLNATGGRRAETDLKREIRLRETQLQQLEWRTSPLLLHAQPVRADLLQAVLGAEQQAIIYHIAGDEVLAFLIDRHTVQVRRRLCTVTALQAAQAELDFQLGRAELGNAYLTRHAARLQAGLRSALLQLYQLLVAPIADQLHQPRLLIIPYGSLHLLPFHALWDGQQYLVERFECTYAPSAGVAVHCQTVAQPAAPFVSFAGLAVGDTSIPQAIAEIETAARYFDTAWVYVDDRANQTGLLQAAQQADILHLATHGLFRPDNPFFSALKLTDGWLDVREIYRLPLTARLVVLSACQSGAGRVQGGDEVIGLARGFLGAGAHSLLVSLWNVHDASAVQFMADFYRHLTTTSAHRPATALRAAQLAAIQAQQHPYFWAPFLVIG